VVTLAINNVAQKEEATLEFVEDVAGARRTQPPVDCLWCLVPSFLGLSVNSDNLPFSYVILFLLFTYVNYMHETWSWHAYRFALGFLLKTGVTHSKKIATKGLRKSPKRTNGNNTSKPWGTTPNHLYITKRFIQGLASAQSSYPLTRSHHEALKLVLEIPREKEEVNSKTKWARVPRDGCHPLTTWVIWRQPKVQNTLTS
jgi:hypothetical protein